MSVHTVGGTSRLLRVAGAACAALFFVPTVYLLWRGFTGEARDGEAVWATLVSPTLLALTQRSIGLAFTTACCATGIALCFSLARLLWPRYRRALFIAAVLPLAIPCYVGASVFLAATSTIGPFAGLWPLMGGPPDPYGFVPSVIVLTLFTSPLCFLPVDAAFARLDARTYDAARTLGRRPLDAFVSTQVRALIPALASGATLVGLYALAELGAVLLLRYDTLTRAIFMQLDAAFDVIAACRTALLLLAVCTTLIVATEVWRRPVQNAARPVALHQLHLPWPIRLVVGAVVSAVGLFGLVVPALTLVFWLLRLRTWPADLLSALGVSAGYAALAATVCVLCGLMFATLAVRATRRAARWTVRAADFGFALPGLIVALGLAALSLAVVRPLYQTATLLVIAYAVLFTALAAGPIRAVYERLPPGLEDAARTLGRTRRGAFFSATLPLLRSAMASGFLLAFLGALKELPATLLLIPTGQKTLATELWRFAEEARYAESAAYACMLVLVAGTALVLKHGGLFAHRRTTEETP